MADEKKAKAPKAAAKPDKGDKGEKKAKKGEGGGGKGAAAAVEQSRPRGPKEKPRMARHYEETVRAALKEKFGYDSVMQVPRFVKIVLNVGVGDAITDAKHIEVTVNELQAITGQRPSVRKAKKAISNFRLRAGLPIGAMVTLRGARMYEFYDRLVSVAVPRIRDFRGLNQRSFDGRGNYSMGLTEQIVFPEIHYDRVLKVRGMDITIVTTAKNDEEGRELLRMMNMPFRPR
jgi:large subunit ribosomal protein L5